VDQGVVFDHRLHAVRLFGSQCAIDTVKEIHPMKLLCSMAVLVLLGMVAPNMYADPVLTLNSSAVAGTFVETPIAGGDTWVYTDTSAGGSFVPPYAYADNNVFTATFTDIAGVALLNINDLCANAAIGIPANSCALGFTFTDASLGTPFLKSNADALGILGITIDADVVGINAGASVGGGSAQIGFAAPSPTPEPNTLTLLGTGLLGMAGVMRKKLFA
jgi:hypothetical protein